MKEDWDLNTGTRYFVIYRTKALGVAQWQSFPTRRKAEVFWKKLFRITRYRAMSYGLGCVLMERGKP